jgi:hypothetical protein
MFFYLHVSYILPSENSEYQVDRTLCIINECFLLSIIKIIFILKRKRHGVRKESNQRECNLEVMEWPDKDLQ